MKRAWLVGAAAALACGKKQDPGPTAVRTDAAPVSVAVDAAAGASAAAYRAALARGRERAGAGDWPGAAEAFTAALAAAPLDARAESELGWALFHTRDLARAEQSTLASIAHASAPSLKAASLYNLGRIREAQGDAASAADAYRASLSLRPSRTVRERLAALDRAVVGGDDPLAPAPLQGPFADLGDYCEAQNQRSPDSLVTCDGTRSGLAAGPEAIASPPRPIDEVRLIAMTGQLDDVTCLLALRTTAGWWIHDGVPCETRSTAGRDWAASLALTADDSAAVGGRRGDGARVPRIVGRFLLSYAGRDGGAADDDEGDAGHQCEEILIVCGVGRSGRPSCTPNLTVGWAATCATDAPTGPSAPVAPRWDARAEPTLAPGKLVFPAVSLREGSPRPVVELPTGTHALTFP
jgi:hypothetical protein